MNTTHREFFGDQEYLFALPFKLIAELERSTGAAIGLLCQRVCRREFSQTDISETIRLALIGGGTAPARAAELVATYVTDQPFTETQPLAAAILTARYVGNLDAA